MACQKPRCFFKKAAHSPKQLTKALCIKKPWYSKLIDPSKVILRNGGLLVIPVLAISIGLWEFLPEVYGPKEFSREIPTWLALAENLFRIIIFSVPAILFFSNDEIKNKWEWFLYTFGIAIYTCSYLFQILYPNSNWSTSYLGFTAPAWTTIFWLYGIGLIYSHSWLLPSWHRAIYIVAATLFVLLHMAHTTLVYVRVLNQ